MKTFFQREDSMMGTKFQTWASVLLVVLGVLSMATGAGVGGIQVGVGILMFFAVRWAQQNPLVRLTDDHMDMKAAPAAGRHLVLYRDMAELTVESKAKAFVTTKRGERLRLPTTRFTDADRESLLSTLKERIQASR